MGFSEAVKLEVKQKAHFLCCICSHFGPLHVHHVNPQSEGGSDTIDNAAPLCVKCHDDYGNDTRKRKWIKQKRDFWYEHVKKMYPTDNAETLNNMNIKLEEIYSNMREQERAWKPGVEDLKGREGEIIAEIHETIKDVNDKILSSNYDIVECLKKTRYIAKYFNDVDTFVWIENELKGYTKGYLRDLPSYRKIKALMYVKNGKKPMDYPYPLSIEDIFVRISEEKNGICEIIQYIDEPQLEKQFHFSINVSEFKNIINAVSFRLSDYIQEKFMIIKKIQLETSNIEVNQISNEAREQLLDVEVNSSYQETSDEDLNQLTELVKNLKNLSPGMFDAKKYHETVSEILAIVFAKSLTNIKIEQGTNRGRKVIDTIFTNVAKSGFFGDILAKNPKIFCPYIILEAKNYESDPKNPEFDQLSGRLNKKIGNFGILACRVMKDKKFALDRCRGYLDDDKFIIFLTDEDFFKIASYRLQGFDEDIQNFMDDKLRQLLFRA